MPSSGPATADRQDAASGYGSSVTLTRTADTSAYAANDVVGAAPGSTAAIEFTNMGRRGSVISIASTKLQLNAAAIIASETSYLLHLYGITPPSALGDNVAFDIPAGDQASYLGFLSLGSPVDLGSTCFVQVNNVNLFLKLPGTSLFGYLVTVGAHTPTSANVKVITLHTR